MPALNRMTGPRGARFYDEDGVLMFVNVMDGSTRFGPREAVAIDAEAHPEAWADYKSRLEATESGAPKDDMPDRPMLEALDPAGGKPADPPKPYAERRARAAS